MKPRFPLDHTQRTDGAQGVWEGSGIAKAMIAKVTASHLPKTMGP
jgi:hypothetical protein